jgi:hypothetical protein
MSAKSRKRNKRLLALAGLAGAVAMSNRKKKSDLASTEDGKSGSTKITGGTNSNDYDSGTKKKPDSKMPDNLSKDTGKDNKPEKLRFGQVKTKTGEIKATKPFSFLSGSKKDDKPALPGKTMADSNQVPTKRRGDTYYSDGSKRLGAINRSTSTTLPGMKSGGRVKGCGKALRGFGKAMKGKR